MEPSVHKNTILGNRDVAYTALQSRPRDLSPGVPRKFGTRDLHLLLGVSKLKYVSDRASFFF